MIVASSPIARCRKPPTFAFAYISPARSSKRRISIIAESHSRATSASGRACAALLPAVRFGCRARRERCLAVEDFGADPQGRDRLDTELGRVRGRGVERARERLALQALEQRRRMDLAGRARDQQRLLVGEVAPARERLPE